MYSGKLKSI